LQSGLLRGHGGHHIAVGVVAWLHFVSRVLLLCGHGGRCIAVMFVAWLRWVSSCCVVSWVLLLHGHGGHCVVWLQWALCCVATVGITLHCILCHRHHSCVATVGVMLRGHGGCRHTVFCVAGAVIVWPWWASCCSRICCMAMVGVVTPYCVVVGVVVWSWWVSLCHIGPW
jgi:hypothetical protein